MKREIEGLEGKLPHGTTSFENDEVSKFIVNPRMSNYCAELITHPERLIEIGDEVERFDSDLIIYPTRVDSPVLDFHGYFLDGEMVVGHRNEVWRRVEIDSARMFLYDASHELETDLRAIPVPEEMRPHFKEFYSQTEWR